MSKIKLTCEDLESDIAKRKKQMLNARTNLLLFRDNIALKKLDINVYNINMLVNDICKILDEPKAEEYNFVYLGNIK